VASRGGVVGLWGRWGWGGVRNVGQGGGGRGWDGGRRDVRFSKVEWCLGDVVRRRRGGTRGGLWFVFCVFLFVGFGGFCVQLEKVPPKVLFSSNEGEG